MEQKVPVKKSQERQFTKESADEFNYLFQKESWQKSLSSSGVNISFNMIYRFVIIVY
jgi:hypothetical protein